MGAVAVPGVGLRAHEDEGHAEEHPRHAHADEMADLPQLPADAPMLRVDDSPPGEQARDEERPVLQSMHQRVLQRALEREAEVPEVQHEHPQRDGHERVAKPPEQRAEPARASELHEQRARQHEHQHRRAHASEEQRRSDVGEQQVLAHVRAQQVVGQRVRRPEQSERQQRDARVIERLLAARHRVAAPTQHRDSADVQREQQ